MKRLVTLMIAILAMVAILFGVKNIIQNKEAKEESSSSSEQQQLFLFNWGNYIDPELIKEFEAETGIQVVYETFDSNDSMEAKLKQGGTRYDLVFPSESSITKLVNQNNNETAFNLELNLVKSSFLMRRGYKWKD